MSEIARVRRLFEDARSEQLRVLVVHHNVLRGAISQRDGLARWRQAQKRIVESGTDLVLSGHDHQETVKQLNETVLISCVGAFCSRSPGNRPTAFHRVCWDLQSIQIEQYRWEPEHGLFKRSDVYAFARPVRLNAKVTAQAS
jgi:predicted phosphodiesterase